MTDSLRRWVPLLDQLRDYRTDALRSDVAAGLTTAVMLIPQAMAYALLAGLPPIVGLYASVMPLVVYAWLGTSRQLAVGPVAMISLLVASAVAPVAGDDMGAAVVLAAALALLAGLLQVGMGLLRLGFLVRFLSHPVIAGFTSAAAILIGLSQLTHVLGVSIPRSPVAYEIVAQAVSRIADVDPATVGLAAASIVALVLLKRFVPQVPRFLVVVVGGALAAHGMGLEVAIVGAVPSGLPTPSVPWVSLSQLTQLAPMALTIALIGFLESIAVAKRFAREHDYEIAPDQELVALGLANVAGSMFGAYPTTGGFSRTAVNAQAGARTGIAGLVTAAAVVVTLAFFTPWFTYVPKAVLAAIILTAVAGLVDVATARHLYRSNRADLVVMGLTFLATLTLGIEPGILLGVGASLAWFIWQTSQPHVAELGRVPGTEVYRNLLRYPDAVVHEHVLAVRIDAPLYFANTAFLKRTIDALTQDRPALRHFVLDAKGIGSVDSQAVEALHDVARALRRRDVQVWLSGVRGPVRDALRADGLWDLVGSDHVVERIHDVMEQIAPPRSQAC